MADRKEILIIDDEKDMVEMLKVRLEDAGYGVAMAFDGQAGLNKARNQKPDLIILDVMMPKLDGYHVSRILKFDEEFKGIPIIMLTGRGQEQDRATGKYVRADEYLVKPFENRELLEKIKRLIGE